MGKSWSPATGSSDECVHQPAGQYDPTDHRATNSFDATYGVFSFKGALRSFQEDILFRREKSLLTDYYYYNFFA